MIEHWVVTNFPLQERIAHLGSGGDGDPETRLDVNNRHLRTAYPSSRFSDVTVALTEPGGMFANLSEEDKEAFFALLDE